MLNTKKTTSASGGLKQPSISRLVLFCFFLLLLSASIQCANIQQPTGGPRDSIPPKLLNESPANLTTNFSDKRITLTFDEFIKLNNPNREISISPEMAAMPTFKINRKQLEINLPDSLAENTTYVINFGQAIADNNEGNPLINFKYVFATGDKIDSLSISGTVTNALTNEPEILISVLLIPITQDSIFGKKRANIFATTDSSGNFRLNYLRENTYKLYALKEQNNDRIYNNPEEWVGFLADSIVLKGDTSGISLRTSRQIPKEFRITERKIEPNGKILFSFNKPLNSSEVKIVLPEGLDENKLLEYNKAKDSVGIWLAEMAFDSLKVHFYDNSELLDSITLRRNKNDRYNNKITLGDNIDRNKKINKTKNLRLTSNIPIKSIDRSKIVLQEDSTNIENFQIGLAEEESNQILIRHNWKPNKNYDLVIEEAGVIGNFEEKNDKITKKFTFDENERYGDLTLKISTPDSVGAYIVELTDETKQTVFRSDVISESINLSYKNLLEGKYRLRVIYDANKNGQWDPGNIEANTQPEWVWYYDKTFIIRPNWEQEEQIRIPEKLTPR